MIAVSIWINNALGKALIKVLGHVSWCMAPTLKATDIEVCDLNQAGIFSQSIAILPYELTD